MDVSKDGNGTTVTESHQPPGPEKDIGETKVTAPPGLPFSLESDEQQVLQQIYATLGDKPISESVLGFAPRWILNNAIEKERKNYADVGAYQEVPDSS